MSPRVGPEPAELARARMFIRELLAIIDRIALQVTLFEPEWQQIQRARRFVKSDG